MSKAEPSPKGRLREHVRAALAKMSKADRVGESKKIHSRVSKQSIWRSAKSVLFYAPFGAEPDLWDLLGRALSEGKLVFLPRYEADADKYSVREIKDAENDLEAGQFGIREPRAGCAALPLKRLDLILVPGIAFDADGHRLGRGKGYYDRLLGELQGAKCGVAFDQQIVDRVPIEPHDMRMDYIVTPTRWQTVTGPRAVLK